MDESNSFSCAILSSDRQYAYNVRNRLAIMGVKVSYIDGVHKLITFLLTKKRGVLLVDGRFAKLIELINEFVSCQRSKNFSFIFLDDNRSVNVVCDNKFTFLSRYENIFESVNNAIASVKYRHSQSRIISEDFIENRTILILKAFRITSNYTGYKFILESVKLLMGCGNKVYSILKDVYRDVGAKFGKGEDNVEKSIRLAIDNSRKKYPQIYKCVFKDDKVSNMTFLNLIIEKIKNFVDHLPHI